MKTACGLLLSELIWPRSVSNSPSVADCGNCLRTHYFACASLEIELKTRNSVKLVTALGNVVKLWTPGTVIDRIHVANGTKKFQCYELKRGTQTLQSHVVAPGEALLWVAQSGEEIHV